MRPFKFQSGFQNEISNSKRKNEFGAKAQNQISFSSSRSNFKRKRKSSKKKKKISFISSYNIFSYILYTRVYRPSALLFLFSLFFETGPTKRADLAWKSQIRWAPARKTALGCKNAPKRGQKDASSWYTSINFLRKIFFNFHLEKKMISSNLALA